MKLASYQIQTALGRFGSVPPAFSVGFELERWIKPGDIVECEIEGIGTLSNPIVHA